MIKTTSRIFVKVCLSFINSGVNTIKPKKKISNIISKKKSGYRYQKLRKKHVNKSMKAGLILNIINSLLLMVCDKKN